MAEQSLENYLLEVRRYYASMGLSISFEAFLLVMLVVAAFFGIIAYTLIQLFPVESQNKWFFSVAAFGSVITLVVAVPLYLRNVRVERVDDALPDVLKHMAAVLKSGGTTESALQEVAAADYGPISADLGSSLKQLEEGRTFDDALNNCADNSGSRLFKRCTTIILDARKAGAGLAEVMQSIAEDLRDFMRIKRERKSRTTMHVGFLAITALFLAPFIFGFVLSVVRFISESMAAVQEQAASQVFQKTAMGFEAFDVLLLFFILFQTTAAALAIGVIREGNPSKNLLYAPFMLLVALFVYQLGGFVGALIIG
ncbi:MAG: type II secretion system F family protein [Candidatus Micrarchaeia archaeon]